MPVGYLSAFGNHTTGATQISVPIPAGLVSVGDFLVAVVTLRTNNTTVPTYGAPSGWVQHDTSVSPNPPTTANAWMTAWHKVATATEQTGNLVFTFVVTALGVVRIYRFSASTNIDDVVIGIGPQTNARTFPSANGTADGMLLCAIGTSTGGQTFSAWSADLTSTGSHQSGSQASHVTQTAGYGALAATGATGTRTVSTSTNTSQSNNASITIAPIVVASGMSFPIRRRGHKGLAMRGSR